MKSILMICYAFPPKSVVGSLRPYRFAKYLSRYGWRPVVLTVRGPRNELKDNLLLSGLGPRIDIYRTGSFDTVVTQLEAKGRRTQKPAKGSWKAKTKTEHTWIRKLLRRIKGVIVALVSTPDRQIGWVPFCLLKALCIICRRRVDAIYTTSPPVSSHLTGVLLHTLTGIPWIADFRDPWTKNIGFERRSVLRQWIERHMERAVIRKASRVVSVSQGMTKAFEHRYYRLPRENFVTITNGFDAEVLSGLVAAKSNDFTICYSGSFYPHMYPYTFFHGLQLWLDGNPPSMITPDRNKVKVRFLGSWHHRIQQVVSDLRLDDVVEFVERVSQREALKAAISSDLLLLVLGQSKGFKKVISAKLLEYIACNRPILAIVPEGEAAEIVRRTRTGYVVTSEGPHDIAKVMEREYSLKFAEGTCQSAFQPCQAEIGRYEQLYLTEKLAAILDAVT